MLMHGSRADRKNDADLRAGFALNDPMDDLGFSTRETEAFQDRVALTGSVLFE